MQDRKPTAIGMFFQVPGLICAITGAVSADSQTLIYGVITFLIGFFIYSLDGIGTLKYVRDWTIALFVTSVMFAVTAFFVMVTGSEEFLQSLFAFLVFFAIAYGSHKLMKFVNEKYQGKNTSKARPSNHTQPLRNQSAPAAVGRPKVDKETEMQTLAKKIGEEMTTSAAKPVTTAKPVPTVRPAPAPKPAPTVRTAPAPKPAPVEQYRDMKEVQVGNIAQLLEKEVSAQEKKSSVRKELTDAELYQMIDDEASALAPNEEASYTVEGQRVLLEAAIGTLPQLAMLSLPGFPGDQILHAENGAQAYEAMLNLSEGICLLLKQMTDNELKTTMSGIGRKEALMAWKAFRFYNRFNEGTGFESLLRVLSEKV